MTRDGTSWLVAGQSLAGVAHTKRLLLYAEVLAGPFNDGGLEAEFHAARSG
jgi:hypothetical protein